MSEGDAKDRAGFGEDPKPFYIAFVLFFAFEMFRRIWWGFVPGDFSSYLSAADVFAAGGNPYSDAIFEADRYRGFPYNYFPGTLYLIWPLAFVSTTVAVALDWLLRVTVMVVALRWLHARIVPNMPFHFVLLIALLHEPLMIDFLVGNTVSYLFAAWTACVYLAEREITPRRLFATFACGVILMFKPFWMLPAAFAFVVFRNWRGLAALLAAGAALACLSLLDMSIVESYIARTQEMREFYFSVDLLNLAPEILPLAALGWAAAAYLLWRKAPARWVWIFGCVSIPIWPRLATYSYVLTLPVILFLLREWGWKKGLLYSVVVIGPIPWMLRYAPFLPGEREENLALFTWTVVTAVVLYRILRKMGSNASETTKEEAGDEVS